MSGMDLHAGSQGYTKFGTIPGQFFSHSYKDRSSAANFQQFPYDQQDWICEPSCWTVPRSRTGGVVQDYVNWTDLQPSQDPIYTQVNQPYQQRLRKYGGHERDWIPREPLRGSVERDWERERGLNEDGRFNRWEPCSPVHYRKDRAKRSLSTSSYRELEAWANRYCHSLPRQRRLEAGICGAAQGPQGGDRAPEFVRSCGRAESYQRPLTQISTLPHQKREREQLERHYIRPPPPYIPPEYLKPETTWSSNNKENKSSDIRGGFSQPPCYIPPPPYITPLKGETQARVQDIHKYHSKDASAVADQAWGQYIGSRNLNYACPASGTSDPPVRYKVQKDQDDEREFVEKLHHNIGHYEKSGGASLGYMEDLQALSQRKPAQPEAVIPPQQSPSEPHCPVTTQTPSPEITETKPTKVKKKRGGETIFCLVSRMGRPASPSRYPEGSLKAQSQPLATASLRDKVEEAAQRECSYDALESRQTAQVADEVDSEMMSRVSQHGSSVASKPEHPAVVETRGNQRPKGAPDWMESEQAAAHREELFRAIKLCGSRQDSGQQDLLNMPNKRDREGDSVLSESSKGAAPSATTERGMQAQNQSCMRFPLWKEPKWNCPPALEPEQSNKTSEDPSSDPNSLYLSGHPIDLEVRRLEFRESPTSDDSNGLVVIDATCVVVKVEFIFPPKKDHVQYICPLLSDPPEYSLDVPTSSGGDPAPELDQSSVFLSDQEKSEVKQAEEKHIETEHTVPVENTTEAVTQCGVDDKDTEEKEQCPNLIWTSSEIPENETLEERAVRILGIPLKDSGNQAQIPVDELAEQIHSEHSLAQESQREVLQSEPVLEKLSESKEHEGVGTEEDNTMFNESAALLKVAESSQKEGEIRLESMELTLKNAAVEFENPETSLVDADLPVLEEIKATVTDTEATLDEESNLEGGKSPVVNTDEQLLIIPQDKDIANCHVEQDNSFNGMKVIENTTIDISSPPSHEVSTYVNEPTSPPPTLCLPDRSGSMESTSSSPVSPPRCLSRSPSPIHPLTELDSLNSDPPPSPPSASEEPLPISLLCATFDVNKTDDMQSPDLELPDYTLSCDTKLTNTPSEVSQDKSSSSPQPRDKIEYPKSLRDAVNRIRKHTAPDSENEEEEGSDLWEHVESTTIVADTFDLEGDLCLEPGDLQFDQTSCHVQNSNENVSMSVSDGEYDCSREHVSLEEKGSLNTEGSQMKLTTLTLETEKPVDQAEEDALSSSSTGSHTSKDTVVMGEEDAGVCNTEGDNEFSEGPDTVSKEVQGSKSGENRLSCLEESEGDAKEEWVGESDMNDEIRPSWSLSQATTENQCMGNSGDEMDAICTNTPEVNMAEGESLDKEKELVRFLCEACEEDQPCDSKESRSDSTEAEMSDNLMEGRAPLPSD